MMQKKKRGKSQVENIFFFSPLFKKDFEKMCKKKEKKTSETLNMMRATLREDSLF